MKLTEEQRTRALEMASDGATAKQIRAEIGVSGKAWVRVKEEDPLFEQAYLRARQEGLEELVDSLLEVNEKYEDPQKARIHSENVRWIASKRKPLVYGDRLDLNVNQTVDIKGALDSATARIAAARAVREIQTNAITAPHIDQHSDKPKEFDAQISGITELVETSKDKGPLEKP